MNVRNFSLVLALVAFSASSVFAQDHLFYSLTNDASTSNSDAKLTLNVGETGSAYIFWDNNLSDLDTGAFLDFATSMAGIVNITAVETFDFDILVGGTVDVGDRWGDSFGPGTVGMDGQTASANAFTVVAGDGIIDLNTGGTFLDGGYNADADAFLFGRIDFEAVAAGSTDVLTSPGSGGIVHNGATVDATFGGLTVNVKGDAIPEPTTAGLLAMGLVGLVARRRR